MTISLVCLTCNHLRTKYINVNWTYNYMHQEKKKSGPRFMAQHKFSSSRLPDYRPDCQHTTETARLRHLKPVWLKLNGQATQYIEYQQRREDCVQIWIKDVDKIMFILEIHVINAVSCRKVRRKMHAMMAWHFVSI